MSKVKAFLKRYRFFILMLSISFVILIISPETGGKVFRLTGNNLLEMASVLPPIFVLLGLLDVWVERETMVKQTMITGRLQMSQGTERNRKRRQDIRPSRSSEE